jgi:hypothetical protein
MILRPSRDYVSASLPKIDDGISSGFPVTTARGRDSCQIMDKQSRTADKVWFSSLSAGISLATPQRNKLRNFALAASLEGLSSNEFPGYTVKQLDR